MANILRIKNTYNFEVILKYKKDDKLLNTLNNLLKIYEGNSKVKRG
jgi:primosomal protein N'